MNAFRLLVGMRLREIAARPRVAATFFGLPMLMVVLTGGLFLEGQPFERRTLAVVGEPVTPAGPAEIAAWWPTLERFEDLHLRRVARVETGLAQLHARAIHALVVGEVGAGATVYVGPRDELLGRGLVSVLPRARLVVEPIADNAYLYYLFPGLLVWTIVVVGLMTMGYRLVKYRRSRFLTKLGFTPLPKAVFIGAQIGSLSVLVLGQVALMTLVAVLAFGLPLAWSALPWLLVLVFLGLLAFLGAGFALASFVTNESTMQDAAMALSAVVVLLSEVFFPTDDLPPAIAAISEGLPSTQLARLLRAVLLYGERDVAALAPGLLILTVWIAVTFGLSLFAFRWNDGEA